MTDNILILLAVLTTVNVVLITIVVVRSVIRRRRLPGVIEASQTYPSNGSTRQGKDWTEVASATAIVASADPDDPDPVPSRTDPLTGLLLPSEWNRILVDEEARFRRYGRPATVVLVELDGLDRLVAVLGQDAGDRILPAVADSISRYARGADQFARLGPGRFGILLLETGEVEAVNYVERIRHVCELWLESGAIAMRLAIGWAAPPVDGSLDDAVRIAQERMFAELRRSSRRSVNLATEVEPEARLGLEGTPSPA